MPLIQGNNGPEGTRNEEQTTRGRVYELFILGELMNEPHYGYKLNEIIQRILGPFQHLSWGTLYPLIRKLEQQGLLVSEMAHQSASSSDEHGPQRKVYHITKVGQERFFALMLNPSEYTRDYPDLFTIKLSKFPLLSAAQQLLVLQQHRDYLSVLRDYYASGMSKLTANPAISKRELPYLLEIPIYHVHKCDAELAWVDSKIANLAEKKE
jgi:DNA-binding PadR family transcriptional regulator